MGKRMKPAVLTGNHFINGDVACAEGAIAAGCKFFGGYPITPATEVAEHISERLPDIGGTYIQMEDEIAAMTSILGAAWTGVKTMTSTSGPGFSLMMETIGLAVVTETPCVVVNVQRAGPSTGLPTQGAQGDMMQVKWGSHGDYEIIALAPCSPQEMFDFTIIAFNLSERYRTPVFIMSDEIVGHMSEKVVIPKASQIKTETRQKPKGPKKKFKLYQPGPNGVAPMPAIGDGYKVHVTGLTHDEKGYPVMSIETQKEMMDRILGKIKNNMDDIVMTEPYQLDDAEVVIVSYGISSRTSYTAVDMARKKGIKVGLLRLITVWPFPDDLIKDLAQRVRGFITVEINMGQICREVARCAGTDIPSYLAGHVGGAVVPPEDVLTILEENF
jgi:2-oxoglutarate ferredoxin oxidoreductase subunit alpha